MNCALLIVHTSTWYINIIHTSTLWQRLYQLGFIFVFFELLQEDVSTTFPQGNFSSEFPEALSQNHICYHWLSVSGNSEIMHCGILIYMSYQHFSMQAAHMSSESHTLWRCVIISVVTDTRTRPSSSVYLISFLCHIRCRVKSRSPCTYNHIKLASALTISDRYQSYTRHANSTSTTKMRYLGMIGHRKRLRNGGLELHCEKSFDKHGSYFVSSGQSQSKHASNWHDKWTTFK